MTCPHTRNGDARRRLLGTMDDEEQAEFDDHLADCADCAREVGDVARKVATEGMEGAK